MNKVDERVVVYASILTKAVVGVSLIHSVAGIANSLFIRSRFKHTVN